MVVSEYCVREQDTTRYCPQTSRSPNTSEDIVVARTVVYGDPLGPPGNPLYNVLIQGRKIATSM